MDLNMGKCLHSQTSFLEKICNHNNKHTAVINIVMDIIYVWKVNRIVQNVKTVQFVLGQLQPQARMAIHATLQA